MRGLKQFSKFYTYEDDQIAVQTKLDKLISNLHKSTHKSNVVDNKSDITSTDENTAAHITQNNNDSGHHVDDDSKKGSNHGGRNINIDNALMENKVGRGDATDLKLEFLSIPPPFDPAPSPPYSPSLTYSISPSISTFYLDSYHESEASIGTTEDNIIEQLTSPQDDSAKHQEEEEDIDLAEILQSLSKQ